MLRQSSAQVREGVLGIGVVGARALPAYAEATAGRPAVDYRAQVAGVVRYLVERGYQIHTGGAVGADQFSLETVISLGAYDRAVLFSAWAGLAGFPRSVQRHVDYFVAHQGRVEWGFVQPGSARGIAVAGLLARNQRLVSASSGLVAFLYGDSRGTLRTVSQAIQRRLRVVVFLCGGGAVLPVYRTGRWVQLRCSDCWAGAYIFRPFA